MIFIESVTSLNCFHPLPGITPSSDPHHVPRAMNSISFLPLLTAVSWTTVAGFGAAGIYLEPVEHSIRVTPTVVEARAMEFKPVLKLDVDDSVYPDNKPKADAVNLEKVVDDVPPAAPAVSAMAEGSQVAFAIPVKSPASIVGKASASMTSAVNVDGGVPGGVIGGVRATRIEVGKGFGAGLPAPSYPEEARLNGWEGSVTIAFAIAPDGRIMVAKVHNSCGRPLLDREALDTVRKRWKFRAGSPPGPFLWTAHFVLN